MDSGLKDKVVWITGASGGIGRSLAEAFAAEGAKLILHGHRRYDALNTWVDRQPWRDRVLTFYADFAEPDLLIPALEAPFAHFGRIDVCVANAGHWPPESKPLHEMSTERMRRTVEDNLLASLYTARAHLTFMKRAGPRSDGEGAALILIGSTAGHFGERGHADYSAAKAGLAGVLRTLKNEYVQLDPYARVNMIEPGWTVTHNPRPELDVPGVMTRVVRTMPLRQIGRAKDVARSAVFLASPKMARHVSGQTLTLAGGMEGRLLWQESDISEDLIRARLSRDE